MQIVVVIAALLLGLLGLAMSLCGGGVLVAGLANLRALGPADIQVGLLITIPCLLAGIGIIWAAVVLLKKHL